MEIYRDKILQKEGKDYTVVDNVVVFKKSFEPRPQYFLRNGFYYSIGRNITDCGEHIFIGDPVAVLPDNAELVLDPDGPRCGA